MTRIPKTYDQLLTKVKSREVKLLGDQYIPWVVVEGPPHVVAMTVEVVTFGDDWIEMDSVDFSFVSVVTGSAVVYSRDIVAVILLVGVDSVIFVGK